MKNKTDIIDLRIETPLKEPPMNDQKTIVNKADQVPIQEPMLDPVKDEQAHKKYCQLFWDYYGPSAEGTAEHFLKHLQSWLIKEGYTDNKELKVLSYSVNHSAASCVLPTKTGKVVYQALKAHRAYDYKAED